MKKEDTFIYTWKRNGTWLDQHMKELKDLCDREAVETGVKKLWIEVSPLRRQGTEAFFKVKTNSRYVFRFMFRTELEEKIDKRIEEKMKEMTNK